MNPNFVAPRVLEALAKSPSRRVVMPNLTGPSRAFIAASLIERGKVPIIVGKDHADSEALHRDLAFLLGTRDDEAASRGLLFIGAEETSPYEACSPDPRSVMERIGALYRLQRERPRVRAIVSTPRAFARKVVPPSLFDRAIDYLVAGQPVDRERLLRSLVDWGYNSVTTVEDLGTFSVRGGIVDVYSPYLPRPIRIDLFGDEVESIRIFDPATQRTEQELEDAIILPAREIVFSDQVIAHAKQAIEGLAEVALIPSRRLRAVIDDIENRIHFFGIETLLPLFHPEGLVGIDVYLPRGDETVWMVPDFEGLEADWTEVLADAEVAYTGASESHEIALPVSTHLDDGREVLARASDGLPRVEITDLHVSERGKKSSEAVRVEVEATDSIRAEMIKATREEQGEEPDLLRPVTSRLKKWRESGMTTLIACHTRGQAERMKSLLSGKDVQVRLRTTPFTFDDLFGEKSNLRDQSVHAFLVIGEVSGGFAIPSGRLAIIAEEEIFGQRMRRRKTRTPAGSAFVSDLADLRAGDYVVHIDHGIGLYHGMARLQVNGVDSDFLQIEYRDGDKLYLPVHRLRLVQKYASSEEGRKPMLSKLGSPAWVGTKKKVKDTLLKMAAELLRLYAMRASLEGFAFPPPGETFGSFEAEFAFEPTPDQQRAIDDVVADLQKAQPMDRLICGDVGYGKTEVAMRAAMMAWLAKKQVAVLVPTTVLAAQHFQVFSDRFANHPVKIGVVSRFQTDEENRQTLRELAAGQIDIIIGTHRLLSKDVNFKDLGLLVIDEEQRFGVAHKEKLKHYRARVHVLTMSATPIPRTLHMGMMGVRDLSVIATPPQDRLAVKTEVHKFSEEVIRDAVLQEVRRGGQCFVVHNRVASIASFGKMLEKLVPEARIVIGHGQMEEERLEKVMVDFMNKEFNVLLSTTIIESGIDIPSANTIIINRADTMGLAQLYQLRGRVGRSRVRGFAYFLIPAGNLTQDARKRIAVLQRFTELSAGFKVATHDLEIRGAGNLLGKQQSGTISAVGFEMYQALLKEAIEDLRGASQKHMKEPDVQVPVSALIPDNFVPQPGERLSYYQRFNRADTDEGIYDLLQEIADLYGTPPAEVENLGSFMLVKSRLSRLGALSLDYGAPTKTMPPRIVVKLDPESPGITPAQLVEYVQRKASARKLTPDGRLMVYLQPFEDVREILQQTKEQLDELLKLKAFAPPPPPPPRRLPTARAR